VRRRDCLAGLLCAAATSRASAAGFPERPITLSNGYPPGGSTDVSARLIIDGMMRAMPNSRVIVENRPGASGTVACDWLRRQGPDGYTLLLSESSSFAIWPSMHAEGTKYDPLADFDWVSTVCTAPLVFVVSPDFPATTVEQAIEVLRSPRSDKLDYSSSGAGSIPHIAAEMLRKVVGDANQSRHVSYRGGAQAVLSVSKGETAWGVASLGSAAGLLQGGGLRALAVTGAKRFSSFPDVPTFTERGFPEMEVEIYYLVHAPARLPGGVHETLSGAIASALVDETVRARFTAAGMQAWTGPNTPATTRAIVQAELKRFKEVSQRTGIRISA
jgi:tripartite-type tricarboxylate transporter receptor subunit TctC